MHFKAVALLSAVNCALGVSLVAVSDNDELNNKGLSSIHEGAGINYFFLGENGEDFTYDADKNELSTKLGTLPTTVGVEGSILINGVLGPAEIKEEDGKVTVNGIKQFYGCKNANDPYRYSQSSYMVTTDKSSGDCVPMEIKFSDSEEESSSAPAAPSSSAPEPSVTSSFEGFVNSTVTTSLATTTTINTCNEDCTKPVGSSSAPESSTVAEVSTIFDATSAFEGGAGVNAGSFGLAGLALAGALLV